MTIPFTKAHGAKNDFLLTWSAEAPHANRAAIAVAICHRHTGIGADGWLLVRPADEDGDASIQLFNSDGSEPELSGNGTRCAAAFLVANGHANQEVTIYTGAGPKRLRMLEREDNRFLFEMNMGAPKVQRLSYRLELQAGERDSTIVDAGNPQCALFVDDFSLDWRRMGAEIERHSAFPNRTNVSFVRVVDDHTIDVRFFERGAGETMSSGTGSTGAAAAALARGLVSDPITIMTPAGDMHLRMNGGEAYLVGPVEIVGKGEFYL